MEPAAPSARRLVAVCIATCSRPLGLRRALLAVAAQRFEQAPLASVEVVVVDNCAGAEPSAASICDELRAAGYPLPLRCHEEPRRGIAYARNAALAAVSPEVDLVAFVDDDETPEPFWLDELLAAHHRYGADVVAGPVVPHFISPLPRWNRDGAFHRRPRHPTGTRMAMAGAGNLLFRKRLVAAIPGPFDERYALSGGEDHFLFRRLALEGATIVWADGAVVHEWIPSSRTTLRWVVRRAHRTMIDVIEFQLLRRPSTVHRALRLAHALTMLARAAFLLPVATVLATRDDGVRFVHTLELAARGTGTIAAVLGRRYDEYRRVHPV